MRKPRRLDDAFRFPGFRPEATVRGIFGDPKARILRLLRREKNGLWIVWTEAANLLRPQDPPSARPRLWRHPGIPGDRDPARELPELRRREAREAALVGQQPL